MTTPPWFAFIFWTFSLLASSFYGWKAFDIFDVDTSKKTKEHWGWWVHQVWFNFSGALVGWVAIWVVLQDSWPCLTERCTVNLTWENGFLLAAAFVGVTGHLPFAISGVLQAVKELALKAAGLGK